MKKAVHFPFALTCALLLSSVASAQKSLVIGIDGLGFGGQGFAVASTPSMDSLIDGSWAASYKGAYSDSAFAGGLLGEPSQQATSSGPGWSTIHTGVWVDQHNVPNNSFSSPDYENNPTYLETLEESIAGFHSASIVNWDPINDHIVSSVNDGNSSMDFTDEPGGGDEGVRDSTVSHLATINTNNPAAIFIQFDEVDGAGHATGSNSVGYANKVTETDGLVGDLLSAVISRPNFANEDWQIIVTSDHGHQNDEDGDHGGQSEFERKIPFIVSSKNLNQGGLPTVPQQVSHADVAPTVLDHFGVTIPSHYYGVSRASGAVFGDPDINGDGSVTGDGTGTFENDDVVAFVSLWLTTGTAQDPNPADLNNDGIVDINDWGVLNAANPSMASSVLAALGSHNVPEPATWIGGALLTACWLGWLRRPAGGRAKLDRDM